MNIGRYITGWAEVRVTGAEPERLLQSLAERNIPFWQVSPVADYTVSLRLPAGAARLIAPLAASMGCQGEVLGIHGLPALARKARHRRTLAVLLLAAMALLTASMTRVWDIQITGNETIPEGVIRQALSECGVDIGASWMGFSQDSIRNGMILRVPEIRWMTVSMQGCRARVIIREKRRYIEPVQEDEPVRIVSDKAGLVTAVYALQGTAETEANRAVLPGDTIIGGYATGRFGVQGPVRAIGYAELRTWHEITAAAPLSVSEKVREVGKTASFALILGKLRINFYKGSSICPADCDKIIKRYELSRAGAFSLPVALEKTVVTGYDTQPQQALELRGELEQLLSDELAARMGESGEILESRFTASEADGLLYVTLHAQCREKAGRAVPLDQEELGLIHSKIPQTEDTDT